MTKEEMIQELMQYCDKDEEEMAEYSEDELDEIWETREELIQSLVEEFNQDEEELREYTKDDLVELREELEDMIDLLYPNGYDEDADDYEFDGIDDYD
ncbi:MAG: hypothetical protein Q4E31_10325 [Intestinibacter bartlettii]|uniref:hypothetical protein n=1 Tax=Intestinibacter bartlettii TaxID=261299 RepID=UPI0026F1B02D|nr:hypothetical protein [Intestinibacter bartlettii]MDO5011209.1 hypothetical protein [Intestinibacter bartlettii]